MEFIQKNRKYSMLGDKLKSTDLSTKPTLRLEETDNNTRTLKTGQSIVFSDWILFKMQIEEAGLNQGKNIIFDMSEVITVDNRVLDKLIKMKSEFVRKGLYLNINVTKIS